MATFEDVQYWLNREREQRESVRGKDCPFRVVFSFPVGQHFQYFPTYQEALQADDRSCRSGLFGCGFRIDRWRRKRIEKRGPRGGWKTYKPNESSPQ